MNRFILALLAFFVTSIAFAAEPAVEESYSADTIKESSINSVDTLIAYSSKKHPNIKEVKSESVLFLQNGKTVELTQLEKDNAITSAKKVQVMGNEKSIVINVITL